MKLNLKEIKEKIIWDNFLIKTEEKTFLQSWNWGEFQKATGNKIWRLGLYEKEELIALVLVIKIESKRGRFLLVQHGPSFAKASAYAEASTDKSEGNAYLKHEILKNLLEELKKIGEKEGASFIRIASLLERNKENEIMFKDLGFRRASMHANAYEATWKLDITLSEEEILRNMRKTTRYLIRQAMKNPEIKIERSAKLDDLIIYQNLNRQVAKRQKFIPFSDEYIKKEFEAFLKDNQAILFFGKYKGELAAGALIIFWSGIGFYHQAASLSKYAKLSIPYLLQWEAIKEAKKRGCVLYDFWGYTDPQKFPKHPWSGPTLFKMGFGGHKKEYLKTQDFVLSEKYWFNWMIENFRKIKRGL